MNCGDCIHYNKGVYKNWGTCAAPYPAWLEGESSADNVVFITEDDHPHNYAKDCDLFKQVHERRNQSKR